MSRAVLITGASRGIGRAVAQRFAADGDRIAVHYGRSVTSAEETLAALEGTGHVLVQAELADAAAVRDMVDAAAAQLGGLDVLVNNAAVNLEHPPLATSYEDWQDAFRRTVEVNLYGAANASWCAVQHMRGRGGRIVNVSSRGAFRGEPRYPAYGASKAALNALGQSLAVALAPEGIAVATVAPGFIASDMARPVLQGPSGDAIRAQSPFDRVGTVEEVAAAVHFLASPDAVWASGAVLDLNGASYLRT